MQSFLAYILPFHIDTVTCSRSFGRCWKRDLGVLCPCLTSLWDEFFRAYILICMYLNFFCCWISFFFFEVFVVLLRLNFYLLDSRVPPASVSRLSGAMDEHHGPSFCQGFNPWISSMVYIMKLKGILHFEDELCLTFLDFKKTMSQDPSCKNFGFLVMDCFLLKSRTWMLTHVETLDF